MNNIVKLLTLLSLSLFGFSCSPEADNPEENLFRENFKNTVWLVDNDLLRFSTEKLFYLKSQGECYFWEKGSFDNVSYDNCKYKNITYDILLEDKENFVVREVTSGGSPSSLYCDSEEIIIEFHLLDENSLEVKVTFKTKDIRDSSTEIWEKVYDSFETNKCVNGTLNNFGWG
jgi:hypothetical protein